MLVSTQLTRQRDQHLAGCDRIPTLLGRIRSVPKLAAVTGPGWCICRCDDLGMRDSRFAGIVMRDLLSPVLQNRTVPISSSGDYRPPLTSAYRLQLDAEMDHVNSRISYLDEYRTTPSRR